MKFVSKLALASALFGLGLAEACATPQELNSCSPLEANSDCDIILTPAALFEADGGAQGGAAGNSFMPPTAGTGGSSGPASGGSASSQGASGSGNAAGNSGAGGTAGSAGAGGTAGSGGTPGTAGAGGTAGTAGTAGAGGTAGTAGTAGTTGGTALNPANCDFDDRTGCEAQACETACPTNMGNYCSTNCPLIIACLSADPSCITAQDPMCSVRSNGTPNQCTTQVENSGTVTQAGQPSFVANALVQCLCSAGRL